MGQVNSLKCNKAKIDSTHLSNKISRWGATLAGFGDVSCGLAGEFRHIPRAISLAIKHPPLIQSIIRKKGVTAYNNQFPEIDSELESIQEKIVTYLRLQGWRALAIPPDSDQEDMRFISRLFPLFQHKTAATCAGLGWIGKNGLLVTRQYGARLSWATVLTDAPLEVSQKPCFGGRCGTCSRCVTACPAGAVSDREWSRTDRIKAMIDVDLCAGQLARNFPAIGKYICGVCVAACPLGKRGETDTAGQIRI
ncbi:MAG: epoxyqueuosine reductase [Firmicutes bacterium HGW-Firmicutes-14]|nr:MAG: epoxyqueuosine reductase [Firmicutes bacterium HGW-Firmicutes-14]